MTITVEATYENGVLKPKQPLALSEGAEVQLTIQALGEDDDPLGKVIGICKGISLTNGADQHDQHLYGKLHP